MHVDVCMLKLHNDNNNNVSHLEFGIYGKCATDMKVKDHVHIAGQFKKKKLTGIYKVR